MILAIVAAGLLFLAMPLKLAVERPKLEGAWGAAFGWFFAMDQPYNLCPSLHIALRTLLADVYARSTRGLINAAAQIWFSLIGFSTLFMYQHHVIDVVGGFILAIACFYLVPSLRRREPVTPNRRVGGYYLAMAAAAIRTGHARLSRGRPAVLACGQLPDRLVGVLRHRAGRIS